ncbi:MAG: hypothetical protein H6737_07245 [Alphaproteobacteria bacterium]|nr:hypothetical protein [Alphaproteobacteria bacterium]
MIALLVLFGCGSVGGLQGEDGQDPENVGPGAKPELTIDAPAAASYLTTASVSVTGAAADMESVTVNGVPATLSGGTYSANQSLVKGLNLFDVRGTDIEGRPHRRLRSALKGEFHPPSGFVGSALQVHLGASELDAVTPLLGGIVDPAALSDQVVAMNPVVDDGSMVANVTGVTFAEPIIIATPVEGLLDVAITLPAFEIPIEVETTVLFFPIGLDGALRTDELVVTTSVALAPDGQGGLDVQLVDTTIEMVNFEIDISGLADFIEDAFMSDEEAELMVAAQLDGVVASLQTTIDEMIAGLDLSLETELMGQQLALDTSFSAAGVDSTGIWLGLDVQADVSGASVAGAGHLYQGAPTAMGGDTVTVQVADDFMNRFLHELWGAGAVDIDLPIEPTGLESALLLMFGGQQGQAGSLSLRSALPPTWIGRGGDSRLQLGEVVMTVETPGGEYGDVVELAMAVDAKAEFAITETGAGIVLSDADITLEPLGEGEKIDALRAKVPELQTAMGIGIGLLNDMLSFPIEGFDTSVLPELGIVRDPSDRGLMLQISLADLDLGALLGGTPVEPDPGTDPNADPNPPAPTVPEAMEVAIPDTAVVYDSDGTVDFDGETGWVCRNDDIEVLGNDGTWYVDNRGEVTLVGTGHTVYAHDNADVILLSTGNTVYADVGADVDDQDGTNTIIWVDPMTFDTSLAPADGC